MGDFNAKIACGVEGESLGNYCLGKRNNKGDPPDTV